MDFDSEFHKGIVDNLHDGVYYVDRARRITYWNRGAERISGHRAQDVVGRHCSDGILMHTDETGRVLCFDGCPLVQTLADGRERKAHVYLRHREGARVPVGIRIAPVRDSAGQIVGAVEIFDDESEREEAKEHIEELRRLSILDPVTGVGNRRWVEMSIRARLDDLDRFGLPFGILFADVDEFKGINDRYGHDAGDAVLRAIATTMAGAVRGTDSVGRWGGDEFVGLHPATDVAGLAAAGERVRALVRAISVPFDGRRITPHISIGGTVARRGDDLGGLISRADDAMYRSKQAGRDRVTIDDAMPAGPAASDPAGAVGAVGAAAPDDTEVAAG